MSDQDKIQRTVLPIPDRPRRGLVTYDAKDPDTKFPPITQLRPPKGAPNVLIVLIDDAGFGSSSAFGGPCQTPNAEKLAAGLARAGVTTVSGLARGIDGIAHKATLQAGGRTLAVLAGGLSRIYPPEHKGLADEVAAS